MSARAAAVVLRIPSDAPARGRRSAEVRGNIDTAVRACRAICKESQPLSCSIARRTDEDGGS